MKRIANLNPGDEVPEVTLTAKTVLQGKVSKAGNPYQHVWLSDGGDVDIRFSLFGKDVNAVKEGESVHITNGYIKEYPEGSGKLQIAPSRQGGEWEVLQAQAQPQRVPTSRNAPDKKDFPEPAKPSPAAQTVMQENDERERRIVRQACLKAAGALLSTPVDNPTDKEVDARTAMAIRSARLMTRWVLDLGPHWMGDPTTRKTFWAELGGHGLDSDDAHERLKVSSMYDFEGTKEEALNIILDKTPPSSPQRKKATAPSDTFPVENISNWGEFWGAVWANLDINQSQALAALGVTAQEEITGVDYQAKYQTVARAVQ